MSGSAYTLVLTDVVDSTDLTERIGDAAMAAVWESHDRAARDLLRRWHGREIDKTDGMLTLFADPDDGVEFVQAYHLALVGMGTPLKARAGLHVGPVALRENTAADVAMGAKPLEVDGLAKPIVARVMMIAQGGQTLLTAEARAALGPAAARLPSHGHWRVKGIAEPFEVFELVDTGAAGTPPPSITAKAYRVTRRGEHWLPVDQVARNLPAERDEFVGREEALDGLAQRLVRGARLMSIVGIGGSGKTRLATHLAWRWLGDFPGGVWFCDLAAARDIDGIVHAVAEALDLPLGREDPVVQLGHAIAGRGHCLVIFDNFEQVSRLAEDTLGRWLSRAVQSQFVVTTREVLGLPGEEIFGLAPMSSIDARELFVRRAAAAGHGFVPTSEDHSAIAPLVALLDRLPLAIELAAARVRVMSPRTLLARMSDRFKLLSSSGGRRDRQATLRATFDWSWDLLPAADKAALAQLSVFEGGFTLESAEAVLDLGDPFDAYWSIDVVQSLVNKSFVRPVGDRRFELLGLVQEYAADKLGGIGRYLGSGPEAEAAASARHSAHFAALGEAQAIADACAELDNLVVACRRATARHDGGAAVGALENAWAALRLRGPFRVGVDLACAVCDLPGLATAQLARAQLIAGAALDASGQTAAARARFEASLGLAQQASDPRCQARALGNLGDLLRNEGKTEDGRVHLAAALAMASEIGDLALQCQLHNGLGTAYFETGLLAAAGAEYQLALGLARQIADRRWEGGTLGNLGNLHASQGRIDEARSDYEAGLGAARAIGNRQWQGNMLCNLGFLHVIQHRLDEALTHFQAALTLARELGHARLECIALGNLGIVFDSLGQSEAAQLQYEAALTVAREIRERRYEGQFLSYLGLLHARAGRPVEARTRLALAESLLREVSDTISLGVLLCNRAEAEQLAGAGEAAQAALAEARALATGSGAGTDSELGLALAKVDALLLSHSPRTGAH